MLRTALAALALLVPSLAAAQAPGAEALFASRTQEMFLADRQAAVARMCGLRSEGWFDLLDFAIRQALNSEARKAGLHGARLDAVVSSLQEEARQRQRGCAGLLNSPVMDRLDDLEGQLNGGYH